MLPNQIQIMLLARCSDVQGHRSKAVWDAVLMSLVCGCLCLPPVREGMRATLNQLSLGTSCTMCTAPGRNKVHTRPFNGWRRIDIAGKQCSR